MILFPYKRVELSTTKSKEEIWSQIEERIEVNKTWSGYTNRKSVRNYEGYTDREKDLFYIRRILKSGSNGFIPMYVGRIKEGAEGLTIQLTVRLQKITALFFLICLGFLVWLVIASMPEKYNPEFCGIITETYSNPELAQHLTAKEVKELIDGACNRNPISPIPFILLFSFYAIPTVIFSFELAKTEIDIQKMVT